uniref:Titin n=1 Tax=Paramormyrops kingsleyae TaxID=1676925 RepID=A0A3B3QDD8_9TELE
MEINKESVTLQWEIPVIDGGSKITNYIIEKREATRKAYAAVITHCAKCSVRIPNLAEGSEYYFRVRAENDFGIGEPVEMPDPVRASQAPTRPEKVNIADITKNSVSLVWTKPKHDGGNRITGYVIEAQKKGSDQWSHVTAVKTLDYVVKNLNENEEYTFRVMAVNNSGRSDPCNSRPVVVKEQNTEPEFDLHGICHRSVIAKAGDDIKVEIPVFGHPKPSISWKKDDQTLKLTPRVNTEDTPVSTILSIGECTRSDSGQYSITGKNMLGTVTEIFTVKVHDIPGPPKGPIKLDKITRTYIVISWDSPENDGGVPINNYIVELRETTSTTWLELSSTVIRTTFKADCLTTGLEYQFRVKAKNRYGVGPPITSESVVAAYPFKVPGPPGTPHVVSFTRDSITVGWNEPVNDGGNEVIGYHVERKERSAVTWQRISKALVVGNMFKSIGLEDGIAYEFRVAAENQAGVGKPSKPSEPMLALDPVDPPGQPVAIDITKWSVTIQWTKPEYDGGFKITGYTVEKKDLPNGRWVKANFSNIVETVFTISGLTENASYEFRVSARNSAGAVSEPSEPSDPITCKDDIEEPRVMVDAKFKDVILVKAGDVFKLEADVAGQPLPSIVWTKDGKEVENTMKLQIKTSDLTAALINKDSLRRDGGMFTLTASNLGGFAKHIFNVKVLDRPGPPRGPLAVTDLTAENCVLTWSPPSDDGGANINHYVVEKRETSRLAWTNVASELQVNQFMVTKLLKGNEYIFRVMAVNKFGIGEPLESDPTVAVNPYVTSDPPPTPEVTTITKDSMIVFWDHPKNNGGSNIFNYIIERRDRTSLQWVRCNKKDVTDVNFKVTGLLVGHEYEFRISAENAAGLSVPSPSSPFYKASDTIFKPGAPGNPRILDTTKSSITLAWNKPVYDGGSDILGYIVETSLPDEDEWTVVTPKDGQEYMFRVSARNEKGTSEPRQIGVPVIIKELVIVPAVKLLFSTFSVLAGEDLTVNIPYAARPKATVSWQKDGTPLKQTSRVKFETTSDQLCLVVKEACRDDVGQYSIKLSNNAGETTADIAIVVLDKPGPPRGPVQVDEVTSDSVTFSWKPPEYDGGCTIKNYIVEKRETSSTNWQIVAQNLARTTIKAGRLKTDTEYQFRITAENRYGKSTILLSTGPITAKDEVDPPRISIDPQYTQTLFVNAGDNFKIDADVHGKPIPTIYWMKGKQELTNTLYREIRNTDHTTCLSVKEARRVDGGEYTLLLKNIGGEKSVCITVKVLDKPVKEITKQSITL